MCAFIYVNAGTHLPLPTHGGQRSTSDVGPPSFVFFETASSVLTVENLLL